ncbi:MAG: CopD family protein [Candidatus Thermoplasmatota archaeon]|nr:CopD family protein [Candidatus Thermoplasmatota archaeon]MCL5888582.1 CopD family protein [Candidatus Thermoplasmatota archaeon]
MDLTLINTIILWIHVFSSIIFVGGSFFIWVVVVPASYRITDDEKFRTRIVGLVGKQFAMITNITLAVLIITGIYNATWYLNYDYSALFNTPGGNILLVKIVLVGAMILIMYGNNMYHGKRIMEMAREGKMEELRKLRKWSHMLSYVTLGLMVAITFAAVSLEFY